MKNLLMPRYRVRRVTDLKADELKRLGIKGLALDIDNTIAYDSVLTFIEGVPEWIQTMREGGIRACDRIQCPARPGAQNIRNGGRTGTWYVRKADALRILACGQAHENPRAGDGCGGRSAFNRYPGRQSLWRCDHLCRSCSQGRAQCEDF